MEMRGGEGMSDYETAVEGAKRAGFESGTSVDRFASAWEKDGTKVYLDSLTHMAMVVTPLSDLPALLNPITPEKVEKAVREALQECESHDCCAAKGLAEAILTRLKEDA